MLVNLNDVLLDAKRNKYAVGLFNTINLEMARGVLSAAEEMRSPVIIGTAEVLLPYGGLRELAPLLKDMAKRASVPVVLHFDHGLTEENVNLAMDLGFSSIMYDCSTLDFEGNQKAVADMVKKAHSKGITVEGELGHVGANSDSAEGSGEGDESIYTEPDKAKAFVENTNVDALAVAIGTAHGAYKSAPKLDLKRLEEIASTISTPLVLHGGSGLSDEDFKNTIAGGISKVNIFTDINCAASKAAYDNFQNGCGITDLIPHIIEAIKLETEKKMKLFGSVNKA
ncbi:MAG: class II fructose-bisphosphate aldolase [Clostridia bacterium]|nr:class II fructose-bisphosphate aldolase [Clostridia bacterium]